MTKTYCDVCGKEISGLDKSWRKSPDESAIQFSFSTVAVSRDLKQPADGCAECAARALLQHLTPSQKERFFK